MKDTPMKTTDTKLSVPEALNLALAQVTKALKASGKAEIAKLIERPQGAGYSELIWVLERLSKAALEWQELEQRPASAQTQNGVSDATIEEFRAKMERGS